VSATLHRPRGVPGYTLNDWFDVPADNTTARHLADHLWDRPEAPVAWEAARMSGVIYLFREKASGWTVLVKYYRKKVESPEAAVRWAANEAERTAHAWELLSHDPTLRPPRILGRHEDVLFLEHVDGLTLEDAIAVRRNRPGLLPGIIARTARLLAGLHAHGQEPEAPRTAGELTDARRFVGHLARDGVLQDDALVRDALLRLLDGWAADPAMSDYPPTWLHCDATTSNVIVAGDSLVAIDWERMHVSDPAAELGRLLAEITHAVTRFGGSAAEARDVAALATSAYLAAVPREWDGAALLRRARVHQAGSTLRIARNGWLSREERVTLVAHGMALLV